MKRIWTSTLFVVLGFLSLHLVAKADDTGSSQSLFKFEDVRKGDITQPKGFWPFLGLGLGVMNHGEDFRTGGVPGHIKVVGSYYLEESPLVLDAGFGLHNQFYTQKGGGADTMQALQLELAGRYQLRDRWQAGPVWNTYIDTANRYRSNTDELASFLGLQVFKELTWDSEYLVRLGGRVATDIGIGGERVSMGMVEAEISFGSSSPGHVVTRPPRAVAPHLAAQAFSLQPQNESNMRFALNSAELEPQSKGYMNRVAQVLANNAHLFKSVKVVGHADPTGPEMINKPLSLQRAQTVAHHLEWAGVANGKISVEGRAAREPVTLSTLPDELARNRRVELQFSGVSDEAALNSLLRSIR